MEHKFVSVLKNSTVWIATLGYFVDVYDLFLFGVVRVTSLRSLGVAEPEIFSVGAHLLNLQMGGMLIGGLLWGVLGDKRGRTSVLYGSILLYSLANLANAFVTDVHLYGLLRLIAGIGLAGELGAAVTLVSEILPRETRGYGTTVITSVGLAGAVAAGIVGQKLDWRTAYILGGCLGLILLLVRIRLRDSALFLKAETSARGSLVMLLSSPSRALKYLNCILVGIPIWFVAAILITFSPELAREFGVAGPITAGNALMANFIGAVLGDLGSGLLSQYLQSRRKVLALFLVLTAAFSVVYLFTSGMSVSGFYILCGLLGFSNGYWTVLITVAAEQFGTNLRATVATSVPSFVRGAVIPITLSFQFLRGHVSLSHSVILLLSGCMFLAVWSLWFLPETFGCDLDYLES